MEISELRTGEENAGDSRIYESDASKFDHQTRVKERHREDVWAQNALVIWLRGWMMVGSPMGSANVSNGDPRCLAEN